MRSTIILINQNIFLYAILLVAAASSGLQARSDSTKYAKGKTSTIHFFYHHQMASNLQPKHWIDFVESYNAKTIPEAPLTPFKNAFSFDAGLRFGKSGGFVIMYQHLHRFCEAEFSYHEKRRFDMFNNALAVGGCMPLIKAKNRRFFMSLDAFMRFGGNVFLTSSYQYRDGFVSYGSEKDLNGTYGGQVTLGLEFGTTISLKLFKNLAIESSLRYQVNNNVASSKYIDLSGYKSLNTNNLQVIELPRDYMAYDPLNVGSYEAIKTSFNGYKFSIGLSYGF